MSIVFNILHIENGNEHRDLSYSQIRYVLDKEFKYLDSETVNMVSMDDIHNFMYKHDNFVFNFYENYMGLGRPFPHKAGVAGVWASNFLAWENFLKTDNDVLLVFEDDVFVTENFNENIKVYLSELPEDWDFFSFFIPPGEAARYNRDYHSIDKINICKFYQEWSCAGYAISRKGAEKAIKDIKENGIGLPIDWYMFGESIGKFNTYNSKPVAPRIVEFNENACINSYIDQTEGA